MGSGNLPTATDGTVIPATDHNALKSALLEDIVPRNIGGVATADAGDVGTAALPFRKAVISSGYFGAGMIMPFHDFNGALMAPNGWLKCTGQLVNEANYDATHGAGAWAKYIGASPLDGKFTPNLVAKYVTGSTTTTQDGSIPITSVGNTGHIAPTAVDHTHSGPLHGHKWYEANADNLSDQSFNNGGGLENVGVGAPKTANGLTTIAVNVSLLPTFPARGVFPDLYTSKDGAGLTGSAGSNSSNIRPESIEAQYWIRII